MLPPEGRGITLAGQRGDTAPPGAVIELAFLTDSSRSGHQIISAQPDTDRKQGSDLFQMPLREVPGGNLNGVQRVRHARGNTELPFQIGRQVLELGRSAGEQDLMDRRSSATRSTSTGAMALKICVRSVSSADSPVLLEGTGAGRLAGGGAAPNSGMTKPVSAPG